MSDAVDVLERVKGSAPSSTGRGAAVAERDHEDDDDEENVAVDAMPLPEAIDPDNLPTIAPEPEPDADDPEARIAARQNERFRRLKYEARAIYSMVDGVTGVHSPKEWEKLLDRAGDEIGNGRFIARCLGAERYLDALTVATILTLRQSLIAEAGQATTAQIMRIDLAVVAYYNVTRVQKWIGDLSLVVEGELFGQAPLNSFHGEAAAERIEQQIRRLAEVMLPLQERAARMMLRGLEALVG